MPPSDLCSAIDDSFDITPVHHPRGEAREGDFYNGPRSGHWTVSEGTVLGSGIDDGFETSFNVAVTPGGGVHAAEQPIPGRVLCRLAKANASERKRDHDRRALHVVEEEIEDPAHACAEGGPKQKAKGARFIVPRIDNHRGIRIKSKDGRSEIIREPSLPLPPRGKAKPSHPPLKDPRQAKAEPEHGLSPEPSAKSAKAASPAPKAKDVARIVGKDGQKTFVSLPSDLGAKSNERPTQPPPPPQKPTTEKTREARDKKAAKAAKEVLQETEMADLFMSGAIVGSVASAKSAVSSTKFVRDVVDARDWAHVGEGNAVSASKCPPSVGEAGGNASSAGKVRAGERKQESVVKAIEKPSDARKAPKDPSRATEKPKPVSTPKQTNKDNPPSGPVPDPRKSEPKQPSNPQSSSPPSNRSKAQGGASAAQSQAREEHPAPAPVTWQPPSVRTASKASSNASAMRSQAREGHPSPIPALWKPPSVRTASGISVTSGSGRISKHSSKSVQQFANDEYVASYYPAAFMGPTDFHHMGSAIYEPGPSGDGSKVQTIASELESTPSARAELSYVNGRVYPAAFPMQRTSGVQDETFAEAYNPYFVPAAVSSARDSQRSRDGSFAQPPPSYIMQDQQDILGMEYSRPVSTLSQQHIKQESGTPSPHAVRDISEASRLLSRSRSQRSIKEEFGSPSPQVVHGFNLPSEASSRSVSQPALNSQSPPDCTGGYQSASLAGSPGVLRPPSFHGSQPHAPSLSRYHSPPQQRLASSQYSQQRYATSSPQHRDSPPCQQSIPLQQQDDCQPQYPPPQPPDIVEYAPSPPPSYQWSPPQHNNPPTVYAGRGWISPHPLSVASSEISDAPQSVIRLPTDHHFRRNGASANAVPGALTYEEWRAVQEQQSVLTTSAQIGEEQAFLQGSGEEGSSWTQSSEILRRDAEGEGGRGGGSLRGWVERPRANWSRTTSSHAREGVEYGRNWGHEAAGTVRSDGRVQLRMPWDQ